MRNRTKRKLVWILIGIGILAGLGFFKAFKESPVNFLKSVIPPGAQIEDIYSEGLSINGDFLVAAKIGISEEGFDDLVRRLDLELKAYRDINPMIDGFSLEWWRSPEPSDSVFFKSGERFQVWMFYRNGVAYYCDRGW